MNVELKKLLQQIQDLKDFRDLYASQLGVCMGVMCENCRSRYAKRWGEIIKEELNKHEQSS